MDQAPHSYRSERTFVDGVSYRLLFTIENNRIELRVERAKLTFLDVETNDIVTFKVIMFSHKYGEQIYQKTGYVFSS